MRTGAALIRLYTAQPPNGRKASIAAEELGLDYETHWVRLDAREQLKPEFLAMNPHHKIPVIENDGQEIIAIFARELRRLMEVVDRILSDEREYLAGPYSIGERIGVSSPVFRSRSDSSTPCQARRGEGGGRPHPGATSSPAASAGWRNAPARLVARPLAVRWAHG